MSKHVWRVTSKSPECPGDGVFVDGDACFPVREAMRLCKAAIRYNGSEDSMNDMHNALERYLAAVARMKARKARKVRK